MSFFFVPRPAPLRDPVLFPPLRSHAHVPSFFSVRSFFRTFVGSFDRQREGFSQVVHAYSKYEPAHSKRSSSVRERVRARGKHRTHHRGASKLLLAGVVVLDESHTTDRFNYSDIKSSCLYHLTVEWKFLIYRPGMPPLDRLFT